MSGVLDAVTLQHSSEKGSRGGSFLRPPDGRGGSIFRTAQQPLHQGKMPWAEARFMRGARCTGPRALHKQSRDLAPKTPRPQRRPHLSRFVSGETLSDL